MKKLLFLIVVLALTIGTLASCDLINKLPFDIPGLSDGEQDGDGEGDGGNETVETDIQEAIDELNDQYAENNGTSTPNDFELVAQLKINGTIFSINWTSDNDSVKIELVDGLWCVDVPEDIGENTTYTLTATITTEGGQEAKVEFNRILVASFGMISNPEIGKAYKFALLHGNEKKVVYFDGNNYNNYAWYLAYTEDQLAAVDVYLEAVEGVEDGYRLYFDNAGAKTYIVAFPRDGDTTKGTLKLDTVTPEEYYTWNTEYNTLVYTSVTGESFYIGSSGTYKSISLSAYSYINGATSYVAHLYGPGGEIEVLPEQKLPEVPENYTSQDLVDALYKLESGQTLEGPYELTGVITSIKYAYDPAYNNVSVNIVVDGRADKPVLAYRLNGGEELKVGDTITIFAGLTNYNGTYETTSGGVIREVVPGTGTLPEEPEVPSDAKGILDTLYGLADGESVNGSFTLTGKITALDNYNNPTIVVEGFENQPVYCFKLVVSNAIGDVITVTATTMKNYSGTYEFMNCTLVENGGDTPSNPGDNDETPAASIDMMGSTNIKSHTNEQMIYSANGITLTNDKNTSTTNCYNNTGSYAARFYSGATIKIEYKGMTKIVLTLDDYSPEAGKDYLKGFDGMKVDGATIVRENDVVTIYFAAATDVFQSAALSAQVRVEKIDVYTGEVEAPVEPEQPEQPENPGYVTEVAVGTAYKFFIQQLTAGKTLYFAGSMDGDYLATTDDIALAVDIFFENTDGGYHIYFMNGDTKTYINAAGYIKSNGYLGCHFSLGTEPNCVWTFNSQYGIIETAQTLDGKSDTFFAGTYGSYNTFSLSGAYYKDQIPTGTQFPGRLVLSENGGSDTPVDPQPPVHEHNFVEGKCECGETDPSYVPETPVEPDDGMFTIPEVLKAEEGTVVTFTGKVHSFYEDWSSFNNCSPYIVDDAGNKVLVFRTTTRVYVGDVVTVTGTVTVYNEVNQIAQGSSTVTITTAHTCDYTAATCLEASTCKSCGATAEGSVALGHTAANAEGKCDRCGLNLSVSYTTAELSFSSKDNRTTYTTSQQVWEQNGVKLTNNKGSSTSNVGDYAAPARFYKSSQLIVECAGMVKIEFVCNSSSYATALQSAIAAADGVTVTVSGSSVIVEFADAVDSYEIKTLSGGQVRMNSLSVTYS